MRKVALILLTTLLFSMLIGFAQAETVQAKSLTDIDKSWAKDAISALTQRGVINGYPDGTFRPDNRVTRAEFAKILTKAFNMDPSTDVTFSDTKNHWGKGYISALAKSQIATGYPDGTFRPDNNITRAEMVAMITRALKVTDKGEKLAVDWPATFADVKSDYWAFVSVEAANRLGFLPTSYTTNFEPEKQATRAETAYMVQVASQLQVVKGTVSAVDPTNNSITVTPVSGADRMLTLPYDVLLFRNSTNADIQSVTKGDEVLVLSSSDGLPRVIKATGLITKADISRRVADMTKGYLDADQIAALMTGDKQAVTASLKGSLYNRLTEMGLTADETDNILSQNWSALQGLSRERLASALGAQLKVDPEVAMAIMDRNWSRLQDLAAIQLTSNLIAKLF